MNEADSFIYNFIFGLGTYYPYGISRFGGRFFASYADLVPLINDQFISDYKAFLQEQLSSASSFSQTDDSESRKLIAWIVSFIEYELINTEYRSLQTSFLSSDYTTSFSNVFFSIFFDFFLFENMLPDKKLTSFLSRHKQLAPYFETIKSHLNDIPFTSLLELDYICSNFKLFYSFIEDSFETANIPISDRPEFVAQKYFNLNFIEAFHKEVSRVLLDFSRPEITIEDRNEIFLKTIEYCYNPSKNITQLDFDSVINVHNTLSTTAKVALNLTEENDLSIPDILKLAKKTAISTEIKAKYESIYNNLSLKLQNDFGLTAPNPILFEPVQHIHNLLGSSNLFISSIKTKRNIPAKLLINSENNLLSTIYLDIITKIIPFSYFIDPNSSLSYVYSSLLIPETERAIQLFLLYLFARLDLTNSPEIDAAIFYQLIVFIELVNFDIQLVLQPQSNRHDIQQRFMFITTQNDIQAEYYIEQLLVTPGSYYLSFVLFNALYSICYPYEDLVSQKELISKIFTLLRNYYGAPLKIILEEIKNVLEG